MIAGLHGRIDRVLPDALFVDVGGVIYRVNTSGSTLEDAGGAGDEIRLHTHLFVREDQMTLYGFSSDAELRLFETLIAVSGVGPKLACAILGKVRPDALAAAIAQENADLLATVPGVGKKTAARLILELRGKLVPRDMIVTGAPPAPADAEVLEALRALGYPAAEAHAAVAQLPREDGATVEGRVFAALQSLAGER
jgi:holliday junction DNA helicase RuvA